MYKTDTNSISFFIMQMSNEQEIRNGVVQSVKLLKLSYMPPFVHVGRLQHLSNDTILNIKGFYFNVWSPCWSNKSDRNVCKNSHCLLMQIALTNRSLPVVSRPTSAFWGSHNCPYITRVDPEPRTHPAWRLLYCLKKKINLRHQKYIKQYARHVVIIFQSVKGGFYDLMSKWPK